MLQPTSTLHVSESEAHTPHVAMLGWTTYASTHRMQNNTVAKTIKGSFKIAAAQRSKQTGETEGVMKGLDLLTLTNTLVTVDHRTATNMLRELKLWLLQKAKGEQPSPEECSEMPRRA